LNHKNYSGAKRPKCCRLVVDELRDDVWVRRDVVIPGPARVDFNAAFDVARERTFVCGGFAGGTSRDEVFTWDGDVDTRPQRPTEAPSVPVSAAFQWFLFESSPGGDASPLRAIGA